MGREEGEGERGRGGEGERERGVDLNTVQVKSIVSLLPGGSSECRMGR